MTIFAILAILAIFATFALSFPWPTHLVGYSRIPIYDGEVTNVIALLNVKQLITTLLQGRHAAEGRGGRGQLVLRL